MSGPAFAPSRREIWYADGNTGFYDVRLSKGVWPFGTGGCQDRRKVTFRLHHGPRSRVVKVVGYVDGKRRLIRHGRNLRNVTLGRLPERRFTVRNVSTPSHDARLVKTRSLSLSLSCARPRFTVLRWEATRTPPRKRPASIRVPSAAAFSLMPRPEPRSAATLIRVGNFRRLAAADRTTEYLSVEVEVRP